MRRFGLALALSFLIGGFAHAEYIVIIYKLGTKSEVSGYPGGIGGMMPGGMGGYGGGYPAGMGGMTPGGMGGMTPGGAGGGKGGGVGGGAIGGAPLGGGVGGGAPMGGGYPPGIGGVNGGSPMGGGAPMGGSSYPPGIGGVNGGSPMGGGAPMGGSSYPPGIGGGMSMGGGSGSFGGGGAFGGIGGGINLPTVTYTPVYAVAVVDTNTKPDYSTPGYAFIRHKWGGSTYLPLKNPSVSLLSDPAVRPTADRFNKESDNLRRDGSPYVKDGKFSAEGLVRLAEWALHHGLRDKFEDTMDELVKQEAKSENPHPAAKAYTTIKAEMARKITKPDPIDNLSKSVLSEYKAVQGEHYVLLHNIDAKERVPAEVESRLRKLENNYRNFYYWFALKGQVPKVPDERLVAVLVGGTNQDQFNRQRKIFDDQPLIVDGFLARPDNVVVLANHRLDSTYAALLKSSEKYWSVLSQESVLKKLPQGQPLAVGAEAQTVALLLKLMEEDAETAAVSYEGTRQLFTATGYLSRNVVAPTWLQFGLGSFFETPKGSMWTTVGVPGVTLDQEVNYLAHYQKADALGKLEKNKADQLKKVITDQYWREAEKNPNSDMARNKARTLSWALTLYLMNNKLEGLKRYQEELSKLPRDLEFDADTLTLCFARAFDLLDARDPNKVDEGKLASLAEKWHDVMILTPTEISAAIVKQLAEELKPITTGGGGTIPGGGGRPGVPGGGGTPGGGSIPGGGGSSG